MIKKLNNFLANTKMTLVSGIFILISFILKISSIRFIFDLAWFSILISGFPLLYLALERIIFNGGISKISSALLISIAMIAAITIGDAFAAGEVAFIMALGAILENKTINKAKQGLKKLLNLKPKKARLIIGTETFQSSKQSQKMISYEEIQLGNILRILPGETIPTDGKIILGETSIDQSIITGESLPVDKEVGDIVFCGTINKFGSIDIEVIKTSKNNSLQKLIKMIENAENKKAPTQRIADKWASWLVPFALSIAIITYFITGKIVRSVTVLVVFCPCALVLATPTAIMAAIGQATKKGVIIKSGEALEKMGKINSIAFDKTGTLSYGKLSVQEIISFDQNITEGELLQIAASIEQKSEHPLGKAIVNYARSKKIKNLKIENFKMDVGKGVVANIQNLKINNLQIFCGNSKYIEENGININSEILKHLNQFNLEGKITILVANKKTCIGLITLSDKLRKDSKEIIAELKKLNMKCVLLTGDNEKTAAYFSKQIGIDYVKANLLPAQKVKYIAELKNNYEEICMIGDGINDAPALKTATVGIAMGGIGSDITVDSADVVLINDKIKNIPYLKKLSNATTKTIKFGISLSMAINFIALAFSILGILTPTTGALVHNAGSVLVVLIAAKLYDKNLN